MKSKFIKYWNLEPLGLIKFLSVFIRVLYVSVYEKISSFFWKFNLGKVGINLIVQKGVSIRYPRNLILGDNVSLGREVSIFSEFPESELTIGNNSQVNKWVQLDFSGNLTIGDSVVISEHVNIMSHDHGLNPFSKPNKLSKVISNGVWIGANAIILPHVQFIGENSIIAAGSIVTKNVDSNTIVGGNPAKVLRNII
ncbi:acyltransferase [uncultured Cyclobacterium sp.]|uniref:acyltransferase n=1 Tax=uncultured Cyclobacterium sp. TaxID=453820 RepID=UPI0030EEB940